MGTGVTEAISNNDEFWLSAKTEDNKSMSVWPPTMWLALQLYSFAALLFTDNFPFPPTHLTLILCVWELVLIVSLTWIPGIAREVMRSSKEGKPSARSPFVVEQLKQFILIAQYVRVLVSVRRPPKKVNSFFHRLGYQLLFQMVVSSKDQHRTRTDQSKQPLDPVREYRLTPFSSGPAILDTSTSHNEKPNNLPDTSVAPVHPKVREGSE